MALLKRRKTVGHQHLSSIQRACTGQDLQRPVRRSRRRRRSQAARPETEGLPGSGWIQAGVYAGALLEASVAGPILRLAKEDVAATGHLQPGDPVLSRVSSLPHPARSQVELGCFGFTTQGGCKAPLLDKEDRWPLGIRVERQKKHKRLREGDGRPDGGG